MRIPRITIGGLSIAVAAIAVDFYLILNVFAGILLPAIALNVGLIGALRGEGRRRRFWVGFEVAGILALAAYAWLATRSEATLTQWPATVLNYGVSHLPPAAQASVGPMVDRFFLLQDDPIGMVVSLIALFETTVGLPVLILAASGGWIGMTTSPRPEAASVSVA